MSSNSDEVMAADGTPMTLADFAALSRDEFEAALARLKGEWADDATCSIYARDENGVAVYVGPRASEHDGRSE